VQKVACGATSPTSLRSDRMEMEKACLAADVAVCCGTLLGEGPVWLNREGSLYWVDLKAPAIWRLHAASGRTSCWDAPCRISAIAPRLSGGFIAATERGFALIDPAKDQFEILFTPEPDRPGNRFNDGKVDRYGWFWAGTMDDAEERATGALYRLAPDLDCTRLDDGYRVTNGPAFSPDGSHLYHADTAEQRVFRFTLDAAGFPLTREVFLQFESGDGYPDGMTVDAEGCLWIDLWDGWCVRRFAPDGRPLARISVPTQRPTSCAFGGHAMDTLYITSARYGLSEADLVPQPLAGALFAGKPGVKGVNQPLFAG